MLLAALFVAVLALAGVGIAQRTTDALAEQSRRLVGGDAAFSSDDRAIDAAQRDAQRLHLRMFRSVELAGMVGSHAAPQLGTLKALADDAPLLGPYTVRTAGRAAIAAPCRRRWLSDTGAQLRTRSKLWRHGRGRRSAAALGRHRRRGTRPSAQRRGARAAGDPAVSEVEAGGLARPGARATWRVAVTGTPVAIAQWVRRVKPNACPAPASKTGDDLSPQLRNALERATNVSCPCRWC